MKYIHLYEDEAGESHFCDGEAALSLVDFAPPAPPVYSSESQKIPGFRFVLLPGGWDGKPHRPPKRQYALILRGTLEVTASDGESRHMPAGTIWLMEDLTGKGHTTRTPPGEETLIAIAQLD